MADKCRHVMPNGLQCHGYAIHGGDLCYFHSRRKLPAGKPADHLDIPLLEDRCAVQATLTQVLRAVVNKTIDRPRASLLLYGLQLSLQSVDHFPLSIPCGTVQDISQSRDGEDLVAADPDDDEDEEDEDEDEDDEEESGDSGDENDEDSDDDSGSDDEGDDDDEEGNHDDNETTEELIADAKYLEPVSNAFHAGDTRQVERLLKE